MGKSVRRDATTLIDEAPSSNVVDVNSLIVDVDSLIEDPQKKKPSQPLPGQFQPDAFQSNSSGTLSPTKLGLPSLLTEKGIIAEIKKKKNFETDEEALAYAENANLVETTKDRYRNTLKEFNVASPDDLMDQPIEKIRDWYQERKKEILDGHLDMATQTNVNPKTGKPFITKQIDTDEIARRNDKIAKLDELKNNLFSLKFAELDDPKKIGFEYMKIFEPEKLKKVLKSAGVSPSAADVDGVASNILSKIPQETLNDYLPQSLVFEAEQRGYDIKMNSQADRIQQLIPTVKAQKAAAENRVERYRAQMANAKSDTERQQLQQLISNEDASTPEMGELASLTNNLISVARDRNLLPAKYPEIASTLQKKQVIEDRYKESNWFSKQILGDTTPGVLLGDHGSYGLLGGLQKGFLGMSKGLATTMTTALGMLGVIPEEEAYMNNIGIQNDFENQFHTPQAAQLETPQFEVSPALKRMAADIGLDPATLSNFAQPQSSKFNWGGVTNMMGETTGQLIAQQVLTAGVAKGFGKLVDAGGRIHLYGGQMANALKSAEIAQDKVGLFASTMATTYGDNYTSGINAGLSEDEAHPYAIASSLGSALTEFINPDSRMARKVLGGAEGNRTIKELSARLQDVKVPPTTRVVNFLREYGKSAFKDVGSETIEEVVDQAKVHLLDAGYQIDTNNVGIVEDAINTARATAIGMIPMALVGGFGASNRMRREALYEAGQNPEAFKNFMEAQVDKATTPEEKTKAQAQANQVIQVANTMNDILYKLPKTNKEGREFTEDEKMHLAEQIFRSRKLSADAKIAAKDGDEILAEPIKQEVAQAQTIARDIINGTQPAYIINGHSFTKEKFIDFVNSDDFEKNKDKFQVAVHNDQDTLAMVEKKTKPEVVVQKGVTPQEFLSAQQQTENVVPNPTQVNPTAEPVTSTDTAKPAAPDLFSSAPVEQQKGAVETAPITTSDTNTTDQTKINSPNIARYEGIPITPTKTAEEQAQSEKVAPVIKQRFQDAPKVVNENRVSQVLPDGSEITGRYVLFPADAVTPSHDPNSFSSSEGYPMLESGKNPNDNDYSLPKNKAAVIDFAGRYDGRAIQEMPTITPDGVVVDGNNRTMSGQLAAQQGTDQAYLKALQQRLPLFGFTPEDYAFVASKGSPRIGFVMDNVPAYDTNTFASFNKNAKKEKSPLAKAIELSRTVDPKVLSLVANQLDDHETMSDFYNSSSLARVFDALQKNNIILPTEEARYYNREKNVATAAGKEFLESLMLGSVVGEDQLTMLTQDGLLRYRQKIVKAIKLFTQINALGPDFQLKDVLNETINLKNELVKRKMEVDDFVVQENMFTNEAPSAETLIMFHNMEATEKSLKDFLQRYYDRAKMGGTVNMFATQPETQNEILFDLSRKLNEQQQKSVRQAAARPDRSQQRGSEEPGNQNAGENTATQTTGEPRPSDTGRGSEPGAATEQQAGTVQEPAGAPQGEAQTVDQQDLFSNLNTTDNATQNREQLQNQEVQTSSSEPQHQRPTQREPESQQAAEPQANNSDRAPQGERGKALTRRDVKVTRGGEPKLVNPEGWGVSSMVRRDTVKDKKTGKTIGYIDAVTYNTGITGKPDFYSSIDADGNTIAASHGTQAEAMERLLDNVNNPPQTETKPAETEIKPAENVNNPNDSDKKPSQDDSEELTPAQKELEALLRAYPQKKGLAWLSINDYLDEGLINTIAGTIADQASDPGSLSETRKAFGDEIVNKALEIRGLPPIASEPAGAAPTRQAAQQQAIDLVHGADERQKKIDELADFFKQMGIEPPAAETEGNYRQVASVVEEGLDENGDPWFATQETYEPQLYIKGPVTFQKLLTNFRRWLNRKRMNMRNLENLGQMVTDGAISKEAANLAARLMMDHPSLFDDMALELANSDSDLFNTNEGEYLPAERLVRLFANSKTLTPVHELLHHTERYLPTAARVAILKEWHGAVTAQLDRLGQLKKANDAQILSAIDNRQTVTPEMMRRKKALDNTITYLNLALARQAASTTKERNEIMSLMLHSYFPDSDTVSVDKRDSIIDDDWYQFATPGEFWAVNASRMYKERSEENKGWLSQVSDWFKKLFTSLKKVFTGKKEYVSAVETALNGLMKGEHLDYMQGEMLSSAGIHFKLDPNYISANINKAEEAVKRMLPLGIISYDDMVHTITQRGATQMLPFLSPAYKNVRDNPDLFMPNSTIQQQMTTDAEINKKAASLIANSPAAIQVIGNMYMDRIVNAKQTISDAKEEIALLPISRDQRTKINDYIDRKVGGLSAAPQVTTDVTDSPLKKAAKTTKKFLKKQFTVGGGIDKVVRMIKESEMGNMNEWVAKIKHIQADFNEMLKKEYPKLDSATRTLMDEALRGEPASLFALTPNAQAVLGRMRTFVDGLTNELVRQGVIPELDSAQQDLDDAKANDAEASEIKRLEFRVDLAKTVYNRLGTYINRQYEKHHNKSWKDKISQDKIDAAANYLYNLAKTDQGKDLTDVEIKSIIDAIAASDGDINAIMSSDKMAMDMSVLKHMEDIPVQIRDLMGEIKDTEWNFVNTTIKMASLLERHRFLNNVWDATQGEIFSTTSDPANGLTTKIDNKKWGPLNGKYTSPEMKEALEGWDKNAIDDSLMMNVIRGTLSYAKAVKTSLSWVSELRNMIGNGVALLQNGNFTPDEFRSGLLALQDIVGKVKDQKNREFIERMAKLNIIGNSLALHEIVALTKDLHDIVPAGSTWSPNHLHKLGKWLNDKKNKLGEVYGSTDDVFKIITFLSERDKLKGAYDRSSAGKTDEEIDREAAEITVNIMPTFFKVPNFVRYISRNLPLIGSFASYPAELLRTTYNTVALANKQMKSDNPEIRKLGAKRMTWFIGTQAGTTLIPLLTGFLAALAGKGVDDDEKDGIYQLLPEYYKNESINIVKGEHGKYYLHFMNGLDGQSWFKSILNASIRGEGADRIIDPLKQLFTPFASENLILQKYNDWVANDNGFGRPLYNKEAGAAEKYKAFAQHWGSMFIPQTAVDVTKMTQGFTGDDQTKGWTQALKLTSGQTTLVLDTRRQIKNTLMGFNFRLREAGSIKDPFEKRQRMREIKLERAEFIRKVLPLRRG